MRLLDRYLLREFLIPFGYILAGFTIFWISFDLFAELSDFQKRHLQITDIIEYYLFKMPELLSSVIIPVTLLLSLLYTLTNHARHHEITAIRAAGISLFRLALPYLSVGFLFSLLTLGLNELWLPQSIDATQDILSRYETNAVKVSDREWETNFGFKNSRESRDWIIQAYNRNTFEMVRPHVEWTLSNGVRHEIIAERGVYQNNQWTFTNAHEYVYLPIEGRHPEVTNYTFRVMSELSETPEEIDIQIKIGKIESYRDARKALLSIGEIMLYKRLHPEDTDKDTLLHGRMAAPWTCLVVVLIALPFGAVSGRRNVFVGVASSILICFAYFVCQRMSLAFGLGGHLPAWVAGWLPNVLFASAGIYYSLRSK